MKLDVVRWAAMRMSIELDNAELLALARACGLFADHPEWQELDYGAYQTMTNLGKQLQEIFSRKIET